VLRRSVQIIALTLLAVLLAACRHNKVSNPIADVDSKQPDKVLFDRAMEALQQRKYDVARITLQTLINTYPDSEYIARAKLGVGDSWYAEGTTAALAQAESEYKDFITFFPNMPEAAEAQLKIGNIHFQQMEKPDRDFSHAKRAEEEYRQLVLQFPDSKLVPEAKERLREVQEVLAEREFRIGRFYFLRESWPAAIARLKSLTDTYPLYSQADEALYLLGNAYERQIEATRGARLSEDVKGKLIAHLTDQAAGVYSRIVTRYPVMARTEDAKRRLESLRRPVPTPTEQAIAQNKAEQASRGEPGKFDKIMHNFRKRPAVEQAAKVGEPTLVDPTPTSAPQLVKEVNSMAGLGESSSAVTVETLKEGELPPGQTVPRSDTEASSPEANAIPELTPNTQTPQTSGPMEQAPGTVNAEPERSPGTAQPQPAPVVPEQVNDAATTDQSHNAAPVNTADSSSTKGRKKK
jgi:outer membrane protein assembly factor BamD